MSVAEQTPGDDRGGGRRSRARWLIGWVLAPVLFVGGVFAVGVHVGARHPDMLLTRAVLWATNAEAERPPPPAVERLELHFGWPIPAQASVEEWIERDGKSAKVRYQLEVERQGEQLLVHHRDLRFVEVQGQPLERYSNRAELEAQLMQMAFIPSVVVSPDGEFIGVRDMDGYIERSLEAFARDPEEREALGQSMRSPEMMAMMEEKIGEIWWCWVGVWVGIEISSDEELRFETDEGVGVYRVVDRDADTISLEFRVEEELSMSELRGVLQMVASGMGDDAAKRGIEAELEGATGGRVTVVTATLRRGTLLPLESARQVDTWLQFPGQPREDRREVHRYTFEWR